MIITDIETIPLRIPFNVGSKSDASAWGDSNLPAADSLLVKITTDQGLVGWGEAFGFRAVASARLAVEQLVAPLCIGRDATRIEPLMLEIQKEASGLRTRRRIGLRHLGGRHRAVGYCGQGGQHAAVPAFWGWRCGSGLLCEPGPLFRAVAGSNQRAAVDRSGVPCAQASRDRAFGDPRPPRGSRCRHRTDGRR